MKAYRAVNRSLTDEQVQQIRKLAAEGVGVMELMRRYQRSRNVINAVVQGHSYREVPDVAPGVVPGGGAQKQPLERWPWLRTMQQGKEGAS